MIVLKNQVGRRMVMQAIRLTTKGPSSWLGNSSVTQLWMTSHQRPGSAVSVRAKEARVQGLAAGRQHDA